MKVVIVAGGKGKRLKPFTDTIPKPMIELDSEPILLHIIKLFKSFGFRDFIFCLCYLPQVIIDYFGDGKKFGVKIKYTLENPDISLGTAGAVTLAKPYLKEDFILTYGDILRDLNISAMLDFHKKNKAFATLNVYKRDSKNAKSKILMDEKNRITKFTERPSKEELFKEKIWVNGSFYILSPQIFDLIPENKKSDFGKDVFPKLLNEKKPLFAYPSTGYFIDIGNKKKLQIARKTINKVLLP